MRLKRISISRFGSVVCAVLFAVTAAADSYYVDAQKGRDTNDGKSEATAWQTLAKVKAAKFAPGDRVLFNRDQVWRGTLELSSSGTQESPIVLGAYGKGRKPEIRGSDLVNGWTPTANPKVFSTLLAVAPSNVFVGGVAVPLTKVHSVEEVGTSPGSWFYDRLDKKLYLCQPKAIAATPKPDSVEAVVRNYGIVGTAGTAFITVAGLSVGQCSNAGLFSTQGNGWIVRDCTIGNCGQQCIYAKTEPVSAQSVTGWIIEGNEIGRVDRVPKVSSINAGIRMAGLKGAVVRRNRISTVNSLGITSDTGNGGGNGATSLDGEIYENELTHCDVNIVVYNGNDWKIHHNYIHDSKGVGISTCWGSQRGQIFGNVIYNLAASADGTHYNGIDINCNAKDGAIYNNTVVKVERACCTIEDYFAPCDGWTIRNNIFDARENGMAHTAIQINPKVAKVTISNNLYFPAEARPNAVGAWKGTIMDFDDWCKASGDTNSVDADPEFVNEAKGNLHLTPASPAIDAGVDVGLKEDFDKTPVPQLKGPDIGAFEYRR